MVNNMVNNNKEELWDENFEVYMGHKTEENGIPVIVCQAGYPKGSWDTKINHFTMPPVKITATQDGMVVNREQWCNCDETEQVYYHDLITGTHGWSCKKCRRIKQVG